MMEKFIIAIFFVSWMVMLFIIVFLQVEMKNLQKQINGVRQRITNITNINDLDDDY